MEMKESARRHHFMQDSRRGVTLLGGRNPSHVTIGEVQGLLGNTSPTAFHSVGVRVPTAWDVFSYLGQGSVRGDAPTLMVVHTRRGRTSMYVHTLITSFVRSGSRGDQDQRRIAGDERSRSNGCTVETRVRRSGVAPSMPSRLLDPPPRHDGGRRSNAVPRDGINLCATPARTAAVGGDLG